MATNVKSWNKPLVNKAFLCTLQLTSVDMKALYIIYMLIYCIKINHDYSLKRYNSREPANG